VTAAVRFLEGQSTLNRRLFGEATRAQGHAAVRMWRDCLQTGDVMAHYGLGYTLYEQGDFRAAYTHCRAYAEIVPSNAWAWCWVGKAAHALGEIADAEDAYGRALKAERAEGDDTEAAELLDALHEGRTPEFVLPPADAEEPGGYASAKRCLIARPAWPASSCRWWTVIPWRCSLPAGRSAGRAPSSSI
jgi:tetratricopeptide (TPR) repeat protein